MQKVTGRACQMNKEDDIGGEMYREGVGRVGRGEININKDPI